MRRRDAFDRIVDAFDFGVRITFYGAFFIALAPLALPFVAVGLVAKGVQWAYTRLYP